MPVAPGRRSSLLQTRVTGTRCVADRWPRKPLIITADLVAALPVVSIPLADRAGTLTGAHVLITAFGVGVAFCWFDAAAWDALTCPVSATLLWRLRTGLDSPVVRRATVRADIRAGLAYPWHQPTIRSLSLAGLFLSTAGGGVLGLLVVHADRQLGVDSPGASPTPWPSPTRSPPGSSSPRTTCRAG